MQTKEKQSVKDLTDEQVRDEALAWINTVRGEYGLETLESLPRAVPRSATSCVLARAFSGLATGDENLPESGGRYLDPEEISSEVRARNAEVDAPGAQMRFMRDGQVNKLNPPPAVAEFMQRFDEGHYPDLTESPFRTLGMTITLT